MPFAFLLPFQYISLILPAMLVGWNTFQFSWYRTSSCLVQHLQDEQHPWLWQLLQLTLFYWWHEKLLTVIYPFRLVLTLKKTFEFCLLTLLFYCKVEQWLPSLLLFADRRLPFSFSKIERDKILSDILKLGTSKACQDTDIPTKIVKENTDISTKFLFQILTILWENSIFCLY